MVLLFSSMEMDAQTPIRRRGILKRLYQRIKDYESFFLSPSDLQGLGIQAIQVGITDDGTLQFHPCFVFSGLTRRESSKNIHLTLRK
jgi:hypothetical protein